MFFYLIQVKVHHVTVTCFLRSRLSMSLLSRCALAERDNANVTSSSALADRFVSFTGGNQIQRADCGTNDPGQSSCTGVQFQASE